MPDAINPTGAPRQTTPPASPSPARAGGTEIDQDAFLRLLVAQLKYQDPLNPADSTEFMAQTAQFATVEKLTVLATQGAELTMSQRLATAGSVIGRGVTYVDDRGLLVTGTVQASRIAEDGAVELRLKDGTTIALGEVSGFTAAPTPIT